MAGLVLGLVLVLVGAAELWVAWLGSQRRLPPNGWAGIRLRATLASDEAWYAAHAAAAGPLGVAGGVGATCGLAVIATGLDAIGAAVAAIAAVALLAGAGVATIVARQAARGTDDTAVGPDHGG